MLKWFRRKKDNETPAEETQDLPENEVESDEPSAQISDEASSAIDLATEESDSNTGKTVELTPEAEPEEIPEPAVTEEPETETETTAEAEEEAPDVSDAVLAGDAIEEAEPMAQEPELTVETEPEAEPAIAPETEATPERKGFFSRLRDRLGLTKRSLVGGIRRAIRLHGKIDEEVLEEIEEILIQSDVGVETTVKIVDRIRDEQSRRGESLDGEVVLAMFKEAIGEILAEGARPMHLDVATPTIMMMVGVNGTGKTTTIGKIAREQVALGKRVMLVAADTFRAGAADQLQVWAERTGSCIVRQEEGADPASVVYEALEGAGRDTPDLIMIDTAGRLHNKKHLMEELKKINRVIERHYPGTPHETLLVIDGTTGQNALNQVRIFNEAVTLTGIIMTKLDGTAKGGILIAVKDLFKLPILKIGIGEQPEDLRDFIPEEFTEALFSEEGSDVDED